MTKGRACCDRSVGQGTKGKRARGSAMPNREQHRITFVRTSPEEGVAWHPTPFAQRRMQKRQSTWHSAPRVLWKAARLPAVQPPSASLRLQQPELGWFPCDPNLAQGGGGGNCQATPSLPPEDWAGPNATVAGVWLQRPWPWAGRLGGREREGGQAGHS